VISSTVILGFFVLERGTVYGIQTPHASPVRDSLVVAGLLCSILLPVVLPAWHNTSAHKASYRGNISEMHESVIFVCGVGVGAAGTAICGALILMRRKKMVGAVALPFPNPSEFGVTGSQSAISTDLRYDDAVALTLLNLTDLPSLLFIQQDGADDTFKCVVCNVRLQTEEEIKHHCKDALHSKNTAHLHEDLRTALLAAFRLYILRLEFLRGPIAMLDNSAWKDSVHAELYRYASLPHRMDTNEERAARGQMLDKLHTCLRNERMTLLGLAVWKAKCQLQTPLGVDLIGVYEWVRSGWKVIKMEQRHSSDMDLVVSLVRPFLKNERE
jgi:hypothetical protein